MRIELKFTHEGRGSVSCCEAECPAVAGEGHCRRRVVSSLKALMWQGIAVLLLLPSIASAAELLENGDFELPGGGTKVVRTGESYIPGWTVADLGSAVTNEVTYHAAGTFNDPQYPGGGHCLQLGASEPGGAVYSGNYPVREGERYTVSFYLAAHPADTNEAPAAVELGYGGGMPVELSNPPTGDPANVGWRHIVLSYRARATGMNGLWVESQPLAAQPMVPALVDGFSVIEGFPLEVIGVTGPGSARFNQTGLYTQTVRVTNVDTVSIPALRLSIENLPDGVTVYNAQGEEDGSPFVQHNATVDAGETTDFVVEFYVSDRSPFNAPTYKAVDVAAVPVVLPPGERFSIDRLIKQSDGSWLLEFKTEGGADYSVEYSSDFTDWKPAHPAVAGTGSRIQWIDNGPPKTLSLPGSASERFYRVLKLGEGTNP